MTIEQLLIEKPWLERCPCCDGDGGIYGGDTGRRTPCLICRGIGATPREDWQEDDE